MNWRALIFVMCCALLLADAPSRAADATANDAPRLQVRAHLEPAGPVVAGTQVKLVVDCLTTTWFTEAPNWPLFTAQGALVSLPDENAQNLHEETGGISWFGVSRAYRITPQAAHTIEIPSFAITVYPGGTNGPSTLMTPALKLVATVPPGAQDMRVFFPTQQLTVTQRAAGTESMLIPPVDFADIDGLRRYPKPPATKNITQERSELVAGERTDTVTYLVNRSGRFRLPPLRVEWWNTATQKKETVVLPAVTFSAAAAQEKPLFGIPVDALSKGAPHRVIYIGGRQVAVVGVLALGVLVLIWAYPRLTGFYRRLRERLAQAQARYAQSAWPAWHALRRALRNQPLSGVIPALYQWMDRSRAFAHPARVDALDEAGALEALKRAVSAHYAARHEDAQIDQRDVANALRATVTRDKKRHDATRAALPPLNEP